ncbi:phage tail protein [Aliamphritea hakodatensis]|uniref:phage tail protein n=1 Tax=Aliamphritea hakodatensis TaxID=2895352 RepID=UPI0022FD402A|nr:phage tail protein [Aliamphritea hakodatensis]
MYEFPSLEITVPWARVDQQIEDLLLIARNAPKASSMAINSTARKIRTRASRDIRSRKGFKAGYLVNRVKPRLAIGFATESNLSGRVFAEVRGTLLSRFSARQVRRGKYKNGKRRKAGVSFRVNVAEGRKTLDKAFFIPSLRGSGAAGIAVRDDKGRNDIKVLHSTSVHHAFQDAIKNIGPEMQGELKKELLRQLLRRSV